MIDLNTTRQHANERIQMDNLIPGVRHFMEMRPADVIWLLDQLDAAQKDAARWNDLSPAAHDMLAERQRQISTEGWAPEHDDKYKPGELLMAADSYISWNCGEYEPGSVPINWPWKLEWFKPTTERRNLEKAGALILAEMDRIDRASTIAQA